MPVFKTVKPQETHIGASGRPSLLSAKFQGQVFSTMISWESACLLLIALMVFGLGTKGITNESVVSLQGDMARYLMNGVYFYDLLHDMPLANFIQYTYEYYAKYPALSLGHHPILLPLAEVPFYTLFGISVYSGRIATLFFFSLSGILWFFLIRSVSTTTVAALSSLLFVTSPMVVDFSRVVMAEILTLTLLIASSFWFIEYIERNEKKYGLASIASYILALYAKQISIFMLPVFVFYAISRKGIKQFLTKEMGLGLVGFSIFLLPLLLGTISFSPTNWDMVFSQSLPTKFEFDNLVFYPDVLWTRQFSIPEITLGLGALGTVVLLRDKRLRIFLFWIVALFIILILLGVNVPRRAIYWVPPFCLLTALSVELFRDTFWKVLTYGALSCVILHQSFSGFLAEPTYAMGYEDAAKYIVSHPKGTSVLFSSKVDTGYFTFFVRKWDTERGLVVLRADKVLSTSLLDKIVEDKIIHRKDMYNILEDFGTCYIVLEERPYESPALNLLWKEVRTEKFVKHQTIKMASNDSRLQGISLGIYEYTHCTAPSNDAFLEMDLPLANRSLKIKFSDVID